MGATIYTAYRNHSRFYLTWSEGGQDIPNNRTLIHWSVGVQGQPGWTAYWYSNAIRLNSAYIDGQGNLAAGTWSNITLANGATVPLRSGSIWVGHNADGTKAFNATVHGWFYGNGDVTAEGYWGIATIPRNSQVTTNDSGAWHLDTPLVIYTNRKAGHFTHFIRVRHEGTGTVIHEVDGVTDATTFTPSAGHITQMQNLIPNDNRIRLIISQYNHQVGQWSEIGAWGYVRDANPTFANFTYRDSNPVVTSVTGNDQILVKGQSTLETTISAANKMVAIKGANPSRYSLLYDGVTRQESYTASGDVVTTFPVSQTIGQNTVVVTAFDSRNNNTSVAKQVTVLDYTAPTIESSVTRENNFGTDTTVHLNGNWAPLIIGGETKNGIIAGSLKYRYREADGAWSAWINRNFTVNQATWQIATDFVLSLDNTKKYEFEFQVSDKFQTVFASRSVDVGKPIMFVGEVSGEPTIGIGKMPENGALDVDGDIYANGLRMAPEPIVTGGGGNNGWTTYNYGSFKQYRKKGSASFSIGAGSWMVATSTSNLPVGMSTIGSNFVEGSVGTPDSAISASIIAPSGATNVSFAISNNYGGTVSNTVSWSVCITEFVVV